MIPNKKHQIFAEEYILTNDAIVSYQKAYPKAKTESARVGSYDILKKECVLKYIEEQKEKNKNQSKELLHKKVYDEEIILKQNTFLSTSHRFHKYHHKI